MTVSSLPSESFPPPGVPPARRPSGLTAVCMIAIVLGSLGLLGSLMAIVSLVAGPRIQEAFSAPFQQPGGDRMAEAQRAMQQKIQAVADRYRWPNAGFAVVNLAVATALVAGGIMGLNRAHWARTLLIAAFAFAIVFEIPRTVVNICMQSEMSPSWPR